MTEIEMTELSVVSVPCNQDSMFDLVKSFGVQNREELKAKLIKEPTSTKQNTQIAPVEPEIVKLARQLGCLRKSVKWTRIKTSILPLCAPSLVLTTSLPLWKLWTILRRRRKKPRKRLLRKRLNKSVSRLWSKVLPETSVRLLKRLMKPSRLWKLSCKKTARHLLML